MSNGGNRLTAKDFLDQRNDAMREGVKALLLMNGGGSVALLAFLQAIWEKQPALITYLLWGLGSLVVGVALAGLVHFFRYHTSLETQRLLGMIDHLQQPQVAAFIATSQEWKDTNAALARYTRLYFGCAYVSLGFFVVGVGAILYGAAVVPRAAVFLGVEH